MSSVSISAGGSPIPSGDTVTADQITIRGAGTPHSPLRATGGSTFLADLVFVTPPVVGVAVTTSGAAATPPAIATVTPGSAGNAGDSQISGLLVRIDSGGSGTALVQTSGQVELTADEWDAVIGTTGGLSPGPYYLATDSGRGFLTDTPPAGGGTFVAQVGLAISPTVMLLSTPTVPVAN